MLFSSKIISLPNITQIKVGGQVVRPAVPLIKDYVIPKFDWTKTDTKKKVDIDAVLLDIKKTKSSPKIKAPVFKVRLLFIFFFSPCLLFSSPRCITKSTIFVPTKQSDSIFEVWIVFNCFVLIKFYDFLLQKVIFSLNEYAYWQWANKRTSEHFCIAINLDKERVSFVKSAYSKYQPCGSPVVSSKDVIYCRFHTSSYHSFAAFTYIVKQECNDR